MAAENAYKYDYGYAAPLQQPSVKEEKQNKTELKRLEKVESSPIAEERKANMQLMKVASVLVAVIMMFGATCFSFCQRDAAKKRLDTAREELRICQAENKELNAKLTALKSVENIDKFAVEKLGLVKVTPENEIYLNSGKGNEVVLSQNSD